MATFFLGLGAPSSVLFLFFSFPWAILLPGYELRRKCLWLDIILSNGIIQIEKSVVQVLATVHVLLGMFACLYEVCWYYVNPYVNPYSLCLVVVNPLLLLLHACWWCEVSAGCS